MLSRHPPSLAPEQDEHLTFTLVTDGVESAVAQAKAAAANNGNKGDKAVQVVGGVSIAQQLFDASSIVDGDSEKEALHTSSILRSGACKQQLNKLALAIHVRFGIDAFHLGTNGIEGYAKLVSYLPRRVSVAQ
jgi:hypothetical protein